jgi:hypothetical protein
MSRIQSETLRELLRQVLGTHAEEIGCDTCYDKLDQFVDLELAGKDTASALPLLKRHLEECQSCNEEYTVLLTAIRQMETDAS